MPAGDLSQDSDREIINNIDASLTPGCHLHLLDDEIQIIPAGVGEQAGVEGERNDGGIRHRPVPGEVLRLPGAELYEPSAADENESEDLGVGEVVLHHVGHLDAVAVDEAEEADADRSQEPGGLAGRVALREERFEDVEREAEGLDGGSAGPDYDAFYPESHEGSQGTEAGEDVSVVSPGLLDHTAQLGVTVGS